MVTPERVDEARSAIQKVRIWAAGHQDVRGVVVVGSWARDAARMDSDVDIVVLTDASAHADPEVWTRLLDAAVIRQERWGPVQEVRVRCPSGLEVELGLAPLRWAATDPVDSGTRRVMNDGHHIVYDPDGILAALSAACR